MKYADSRLRPEMCVNRLKKTVVVTNQRRNVLLSQIADGIPTMVSEVIDDQVEIIGQERPKRVVEINGQSVAVAQNEPRTRRVTVASQRDRGDVVHPDITSRERFGYLPGVSQVGGFPKKSPLDQGKAKQRLGPGLR